jgi:hypothetical protein
MKKKKRAAVVHRATRRRRLLWRLAAFNINLMWREEGGKSMRGAMEGETARAS